MDVYVCVCVLCVTYVDVVSIDRNLQEVIYMYTLLVGVYHFALCLYLVSKSLLLLCVSPLSLSLSLSLSWLPLH